MSAKIIKIVLFLFHFEEKNVGGPVKQVKKSVALPASLLKMHLEKLLPVITKLVNLLLQHGDFPEKWQEAVIRPLLKKSGLCLPPDRGEHNNFLGVLNFIFKIEPYIDHINISDEFKNW